MTLFRRNDNTPIKFDIIGLSDEEFKEIKKIVSINGGTIEHCHEQPIKFIKTYMFIACAFPTAKLYNINFITDCVDEGRIIDPTPYRIGNPIMYDDYIISAFLHGTCVSCTEQQFENKRSRKRTQYCKDQEFASSSASRNNSYMIAVRESLCSKSTTSESRSGLTSETESVNSDTSQRESRKREGKRGRGARFTFAEEKSLVMFLLNNDLIGEAKKGILVWQMAVVNGVCSERSVVTLYNRFRKNILPNIEKFGLTEAQLQEFQKFQSDRD